MACMEMSGKLHDPFNQAGEDFLFVELDTAFTFLQVAATSDVEETRVRNRENARAAYETVLLHSSRVVMQGEQKTQFESRLAELRTSLLEAGASL